MQRLINVDMLSSDELTNFLNVMATSLGLIDPTFNTSIGQAEPPSEFLSDGRLAYADGVNWNPAGDGTKGLFRYKSDTTEWVYIG